MEVSAAHWPQKPQIPFFTRAVSAVIQRPKPLRYSLRRHSEIQLERAENSYHDTIRVPSGYPPYSTGYTLPKCRVRPKAVVKLNAGGLGGRVFLKGVPEPYDFGGDACLAACFTSIINPRTSPEKPQGNQATSPPSAPSQSFLGFCFMSFVGGEKEALPQCQIAPSWH